MTNQPSWQRNKENGQYAFTASVFVHAPVDVCFTIWSYIESFPNLLSHVDQVKHTTGNQWHWEATIDGQHAEWDAEVTEVRENGLISWQSIRGLENSGSVHFTPEGDGCRIVVTLQYNPPYGFLGDLVAKRRTNDAFAQSLLNDLDQFKRGVESGDARQKRHAA